jgi:hypothetical protein
MGFKARGENLWKELYHNLLRNARSFKRKTALKLKGQQGGFQCSSIKTQVAVTTNIQDIEPCSKKDVPLIATKNSRPFTAKLVFFNLANIIFQILL